MGLPQDDGGEAVEDLPQPYQKELALAVQKGDSLQVDLVQLGLGCGKFPDLGSQRSKNRSAALVRSVGAMAVRMVWVQHGDQQLHGAEKWAEVGDVVTFFDAEKLCNDFQEE
jgi:hypothetical protein